MINVVSKKSRPRIFIKFRLKIFQWRNVLTRRCRLRDRKKLGEHDGDTDGDKGEWKQWRRSAYGKKGRTGDGCRGSSFETTACNGILFEPRSRLRKVDSRRKNIPGAISPWKNNVPRFPRKSILKIFRGNAKTCERKEWGKGHARNRKRSIKGPPLFSMILNTPCFLRDNIFFSMEVKREKKKKNEKKKLSRSRKIRKISNNDSNEKNCLLLMPRILKRNLVSITIKLRIFVEIF